MGTWTIDTDDEKNRLYLTIEGYLEADEAEQAATETIAAAETLDEGFDMINDLSSFQPSDDDALAQIQRGKEGIAKRGVSAVVRVTSESTTGQMQWDRAGEDAESYQLAKTDSPEKADRLLDKRRESQ